MTSGHYTLNEIYNLPFNEVTKEKIYDNFQPKKHEKIFSIIRCLRNQEAISDVRFHKPLTKSIEQLYFKYKEYCRNNNCIEYLENFTESAFKKIILKLVDLKIITKKSQAGKKSTFYIIDNIKPNVTDNVTGFVTSFVTGFDKAETVETTRIEQDFTRGTNININKNIKSDIDIQQHNNKSISGGNSKNDFVDVGILKDIKKDFKEKFKQDLTDKEAYSIYKSSGQDISKVLAAFKAMAENAGTINNLIGYAIKILRDGITANKSYKNNSVAQEQKANKFKFMSRNYDYDELEKELLGQNNYYPEPDKPQHDLTEGEIINLKNSGLYLTDLEKSLNIFAY